MRDPGRIPKVLEVLSKTWHKYPDQRLCQIISNAIPSGIDGFYLEDDDLVNILKEELFTGGRKKVIAK